jgi:hypothetical protein
VNSDVPPPKHNGNDGKGLSPFLFADYAEVWRSPCGRIKSNHRLGATQASSRCVRRDFLHRQGDDDLCLRLKLFQKEKRRKSDFAPFPSRDLRE